jgi:hypothetical protein
MPTRSQSEDLVGKWCIDTAFKINAFVKYLRAEEHLRR